MALERGYYWIAYRKVVGPIIARWDGVFWWGEDGDGCFSEEHVNVLSLRRVQPSPSVTRKFNDQKE